MRIRDSGLLEQTKLGTGGPGLSGKMSTTLAGGARVACGDPRTAGFLALVKGFLLQATSVLVLRGEGHSR